MQPIFYKEKKRKMIIPQIHSQCISEVCVSLQTHTPNTKKKKKGKVKFTYRVSFFFLFLVRMANVINAKCHVYDGLVHMTQITVHSKN